MKTIIASFAHKKDAENAIADLESRDVSHDDISLIMYDKAKRHILDWRRNKTAGSLSGVLVGTDIPHSELNHYEEEIKKGRVLVTVHTKDSAMAALARETLRIYSTFNTDAA